MTITKTHLVHTQKTLHIHVQGGPNIHLYSPKHGSNNNKETKTNTTKDNYINIANSNLTI